MSSSSCLEAFAATLLLEMKKVTPPEDLNAFNKISTDMLNFLVRLIKRQHSISSSTEASSVRRASQQPIGFASGPKRNYSKPTDGYHSTDVAARKGSTSLLSGVDGHRTSIQALVKMAEDKKLGISPQRSSRRSHTSSHGGTSSSRRSSRSSSATSKRRITAVERMFVGITSSLGQLSDLQAEHHQLVFDSNATRSRRSQRKTARGHHRSTRSNSSARKSNAAGVEAEEMSWIDPDARGVWDSESSSIEEQQAVPPVVSPRARGVNAKRGLTSARRAEKDSEPKAGPKLSPRRGTTPIQASDLCGPQGETKGPDLAGAQLEQQRQQEGDSDDASAATEEVPEAGALGSGGMELSKGLGVSQVEDDNGSPRCHTVAGGRGGVVGKAVAGTETGAGADAGGHTVGSVAGKGAGDVGGEGRGTGTGAEQESGRILAAGGTAGAGAGFDSESGAESPSMSRKHKPKHHRHRHKHGKDKHKLKHARSVEDLGTAPAGAVAGVGVETNPLKSATSGGEEGGAVAEEGGGEVGGALGALGVGNPPGLPLSQPQGWRNSVSRLSLSHFLPNGQRRASFFRRGGGSVSPRSEQVGGGSSRGLLGKLMGASHSGSLNRSSASHSYSHSQSYRHSSMSHRRPTTEDAGHYLESCVESDDGSPRHSGISVGGTGSAGGALMGAALAAQSKEGELEDDPPSIRGGGAMDSVTKEGGTGPGAKEGNAAEEKDTNAMVVVPGPITPQPAADTASTTPPPALTSPSSPKGRARGMSVIFGAETETAYYSDDREQAAPRRFVWEIPSVAKEVRRVDGEGGDGGGGGDLSRAGSDHALEVFLHSDVLAVLNKQKYMLHPQSGRRVLWDVVMTVLLIYTAFTLPLRLGFHDDGFIQAHSETWRMVEYLIDVWFLLDVALNFRTGVWDHATKLLIIDPKEVTRCYLRGWFAVDLLSSLPFALFEEEDETNHSLVSYIGKGVKVLKLFRVLRLMRLNTLQRLVDYLQLKPSVLRMFKFILMFIMVLHLMACGYWYVAVAEGMGSSDWMPQMDSTEDATLSQKYAIAFHWAMCVINGNYLAPETPLQHEFTASMLFLGIVVSASIIGSASTLLANLNSAAVEKRKQLDSINAFLQYRKVHPLLQEKIKNFYEYLWQAGRSTHDEDLFVELPPSLRLQLGLALKEHFIDTVPLFKKSSPEFVVALVQRLAPRLAIPNEIVMEENTKGYEMRFINRGSLVAYIGQGDDWVELAALPMGSFFGEIALLDRYHMRSASVKATTFCDMQVLGKEDFDELLEAFPFFRKAIVLAAETRYRMSSNLVKLQSKGGGISNRLIPTGGSTLYDTTSGGGGDSASIGGLARHSMFSRVAAWRNPKKKKPQVAEEASANATTTMFEQAAHLVEAAEKKYFMSVGHSEYDSEDSSDWWDSDEGSGKTNDKKGGGGDAPNPNPEPEPAMRGGPNSGGNAKNSSFMNNSHFGTGGFGTGGGSVLRKYHSRFLPTIYSRRSSSGSSRRSSRRQSRRSRTPSRGISASYRFSSQSHRFSSTHGENDDSENDESYSAAAAPIRKRKQSTHSSAVKRRPSYRSKGAVVSIS